jgi:hypothetical protein
MKLRTAFGGALLVAGCHVTPVRESVPVQESAAAAAPPPPLPAPVPAPVMDAVPRAPTAFDAAHRAFHEARLRRLEDVQFPSHDMLEHSRSVLQGTYPGPTMPPVK